MKNKNIIKIILTSLISAFACTGMIYAATTIGNNITTGGTLDVTGASTFTTASSTGIVKFGQINSDTGNINFGDEILYTAGNIGIGTSSPYAKLSVVGETVASYFTATSTTATSTFNKIAVSGGSMSGVNLAGQSMEGMAGGTITGNLTMSGDFTAAATYAPLSFDAVVNEAGGITAGKAVYVSGESGGVPTVSLASNIVHTKTHFAGLAAESGVNGATIRVVHKGVVSNIDTSAYTAGNRLHLTTNGNYQTGIPQGGHIHMGFVLVSHATAGKIYVTTNEYTHDMRGTDDEDVKIAVGSNDGTRKVLFEKKNGTEVLSIDGMGNMNFNSGIMYIDGVNGRVGVGTTTPTVPFHAAISGSGTAFLLEGDQQTTPKMTFKSTALGITTESSISYDSNNTWWQFDNGSLQLSDGQSFMIGAASTGGITNSSGAWAYTGRDELSLRTKTDNTKFVSIPYGNLRINRDNGGALFGTGEDAKIYYDGTDLIIDPDIVGSGKAKVNGSLQATDYYSGDGTQGITNSTSYWLCTAANCSTTCQVTIKDGLITGCP